MENELYHYGVKGMKWGVRRNSKVLANHRRNQAVADIKTSYRSGRITKDQKKASIKRANENKKELQARLNRDTNTPAERKALAERVKREVPNSGVKKALTTINKGMTVADIASATVMAGAGAAVFPSLAPMYVSALAGGSAVSVGKAYLIQRGVLDKMA